MIGILGWQNENGLSAYPLVSDIVCKDFIVDASFVQFDGYIPSLETIEVKSNEILVTVKVDAGTVIISVPHNHTPGTAKKLQINNRYIGRIVFGAGIALLINNFINKAIDVKIPFLSVTVNSIPSQAGVYSLDTLAGALTLSTNTTMRFDFTAIITPLNNTIDNLIAGLS